MPAKFASNASTRLAAPLSIGETQIAVTDASKFPTLSAGDWFPLTLVKASGQLEVVRCTAKSNNVLTVARAQDGTVQVAFSAGDRVELRLTAGALEAAIAEPVAAATQRIGSLETRTANAEQGISTHTGQINDINGRMIPFTPVQQGGGAGMGNDKVYIGWNGVSVTLQVNGSHQGNLWYSANFNPAAYLPLGGGEMTGRISTAMVNANQNANDSTTGLEVRSAGGTGDGGLSSIALHCVGQYATKINLRHDGVVGIGGWSSAPWRWYVSSNGDMVAAGNVAAYSDPRLKDDVERITGALGILEKLDGVRFTWNSRSQLIGRPGARDIGVLADQVEAVLPEIVGRSVEDEASGGERWRVVAYDKLVPVVLEAVKELASRVKALEGR